MIQIVIVLDISILLEEIKEESIKNNLLWNIGS